jgi:hypothetical protein
MTKHESPFVNGLSCFNKRHNEWPAFTPVRWPRITPALTVEIEYRPTIVGGFVILISSLSIFIRSSGWRSFIAFAAAAASTVAGAGTVVFAGAATVALAVVLIHEWAKKRSLESMSHGVSWVVLSAATAAVVAFTAPLGFNDTSRTLVVFLAVLPLINVVFDWFSLGLTRFLLKRTVDCGLSWVNGVMDAAGAITILVALAITTTAALQGLNILAFMGGADTPFINLTGILNTLRERPGDPAVGWVYFMLFSTLLPSVAHLFLAAASVLTASPFAGWQAAQLQRLEKGFDGHTRALRRAARFKTFTDVAKLIIFVGALTILAGLCWGLYTIAPQVAWYLLYWTEWTAAALGSPVTPIPPRW